MRLRHVDGSDDVPSWAVAPAIRNGHRVRSLARFVIRVIAAWGLAALIVAVALPVVVRLATPSAEAARPSDIATARALFDGITRLDASAVAALEAPDSRAGSTDFDSARRVLAAALAGSEIEFLADTWGAKDLAGFGLGLAHVDYQLHFQNLAFRSLGSGATTSVEDRGGLEPSSSNPLADAALKTAMRRSFVATVPLVRGTNGVWFVDTRALRP